MTKRLSSKDFLSFTEETRVYENLVIFLEYLDLEEAFSRFTKETLSSGEIARNGEHALELLKYLADVFNAKNIFESEKTLTELQNLLPTLVLYKTTYNIGKIVEKNLRSLEPLLRLRSQGVSTEPFTPVFTLTDEPIKSNVVPIDYNKSANIGTGLIPGVGTVHYENKQMLEATTTGMTTPGGYNKPLDTILSRTINITPKAKATNKDSSCPCKNLPGKVTCGICNPRK